MAACCCSSAAFFRCRATATRWPSWARAPIPAGPSARASARFRRRSGQPARDARRRAPRDDQPLRLLLLRSDPSVAARSRCRRPPGARQVDGRFAAARRGARREHGPDVAAAVCGLRKRGRPPVTDGARSDQRVDRRARVQRGGADSDDPGDPVRAPAAAAHGTGRSAWSTMGRPTGRRASPRRSPPKSRGWSCSASRTAARAGRSRRASGGAVAGTGSCATPICRCRSRS